MKKANYRAVSILNILAAVCFAIAGFLSKSNNDKAGYGLFIVALLFLVNGIANLIKHRKLNDKQ
uniref:Uncharacterized protein n=1 Tax=Cohnella candidum TaxID=2674991 RepID=A0A3G3JW73_9BACL|nr:hypothetical protein EAV92_07800 [Cohnella candidum]